MSMMSWSKFSYSVFPKKISIKETVSGTTGCESRFGMNFVQEFDKLILSTYQNDEVGYDIPERLLLEKRRELPEPDEIFRRSPIGCTPVLLAGGDILVLRGNSDLPVEVLFSSSLQPVSWEFQGLREFGSDMVCDITSTMLGEVLVVFFYRAGICAWKVRTGEQLPCDSNQSQSAIENASKISSCRQTTRVPEPNDSDFDSGKGSSLVAVGKDLLFVNHVWFELNLDLVLVYQCTTEGIHERGRLPQLHHVMVIEINAAPYPHLYGLLGGKGAQYLNQGRSDVFVARPDLGICSDLPVWVYDRIKLSSQLFSCVYGAAMEIDRNMLVTSDINKVSVYDLSEGCKCIADFEFSVGPNVTVLKVLPHGIIACTYSTDRTHLLFLDAINKTLLANYMTKFSSIDQFDVWPNGSFLLSGSDGELMCYAAFESKNSNALPTRLTTSLREYASIHYGTCFNNTSMTLCPARSYIRVLAIVITESCTFYFSIIEPLLFRILLHILN